MKWVLYGAVLVAGLAAGVLVPLHHATPVNAHMARNGSGGMIDVDAMCAQEAPGSCHAITQASDAVAVVRAHIELLSGGSYRTALT